MLLPGALALAQYHKINVAATRAWFIFSHISQLIPVKTGMVLEQFSLKIVASTSFKKKRGGEGGVGVRVDGSI